MAVLGGRVGLHLEASLAVQVEAPRGRDQYAKPHDRARSAWDAKQDPRAAPNKAQQLLPNCELPKRGRNIAYATNRA